MKKSPKWLLRPFNTIVRSGFKCDAPDCDYKEIDVPKFKIVADYIGYLLSYQDKSCPKCGAPLLTKKDLATSLGLIRIIYSAPYQVLQKLCNKLGVKTQLYHTNMNGTGNLNLEKIDQTSTD